MMTKKEVASLGGKINAIIQRKKALENYYKNPKLCKNCNKPIIVKENEQAAVTRKKTFCNASCSATFNNLHRKGTQFCKRCKEALFQYKTKSGRFSIRKYCDKCHRIIRSEISEKNITISNKTKGELFKERKNWQSARSAIRRDAVRIFIKSGKPYKCEKCNYNLHVEVCHKKPVSEFPDSALIKEINDINNLAGLCENHHWELDNGYLFFDESGFLKDTYSK